MIEYMPQISKEKKVMPKKRRKIQKAFFWRPPMHRLRVLQWWSQSQMQASQNTQWYILYVLQLQQYMQYSLPLFSYSSSLILDRFLIPGFSLMVKRQLMFVTSKVIRLTKKSNLIIVVLLRESCIADQSDMHSSIARALMMSMNMRVDDVSRFDKKIGVPVCALKRGEQQANVEQNSSSSSGRGSFVYSTTPVFFIARLYYIFIIPTPTHTTNPTFLQRNLLYPIPIISILNGKDRIIINKLRMVDRYQSLLGSEIISDNIDRNMKVDRAFNTNMEMIKRANERAAKMRQFISKYKRDITGQADQYVKQFKQEQRQYAKDRNYLKGEVDKLEKANKKDSSEYNFIKKELIKAVKSELDLEFELNQEITRRKEEKELLKKQLFQGSVQIQNAVKDIQAKKEDILYLERLINQCVQLLEIIGVLVHQNGEKINEISREVENANENMEKAEKNIDKARIAMQKSRCKWCCVLFIAIVVIVLGVIVYVTSVK